MNKVKEKIAQAKKRIKNTLITSAIVGTGVVGTIGVSSHIENEKNDRVNTEWKKGFADADSSFTDAKTAHFYAHKKLKQADKAELETYLQKLKNEKQNQMGAELASELLFEDGDANYVEKLLADGAKVTSHLMEEVAKDTSNIKICDGFEMMKRLFEQYKKYGGYNDVMRESFSGYDWAYIKKGLQKHLLAGDERYQEFVDFATEEIQKADSKGHSFSGEKSGFDEDFYYDRYFKLHPNSREVYLGYLSKAEVLDVEIKRTEFQLKTGFEYKIDITSENAKEVLDSRQEIKQSYVKALRLRGMVEEKNTR